MVTFGGHGQDGAVITTPGPELAAEAVLLRPWRADDIDAVYQACQDPLIQRWTTVPSPYLREHAEEFVLASPERWSVGAASFAAVAPASGQLLGSFGFVEPCRDGVGEIGFWVAAPARRQGLATTAVRLLCSWGFEALGLARIQWQAEVGNVASRLVAEASGFTVEGQLRRGLASPSGHVDGWIGSLLPGDPMTRRQSRLVPPEPVEVGGIEASIGLRAPTDADAAWVLATYQDPAIALWNPADVTDLPSAQAWVRRRADWTDGDHASWLVIDRATQSPVGSVSLHKVNAENLTASIGYWTHPAYRGQGFASRAIRLASNWGLGRLGLRRIELVHAIANEASCRAAERAGFEREGVLRQGERYGDGEWYDEHLHARIRTGLG